MNRPDANLILTTKQVCEIMGVSKMHISYLVKQMKLIPLKKLNKEYIWWKPDIDEFQKKRGK